LPTYKANSLKIPLSGWADRQLQLLAEETGSAAIDEIGGARLLGERAAINGFTIPGRCAAGGKCHLFPATDGWVALNLARESDLELLPALFGAKLDDATDLDEIAELVLGCEADALVARGREMSMAIARTGEAPVSPHQVQLATAPAAAKPLGAPLVIDLSALWAGPLCSHLLQLAGAEVVKVESIRRPDALRQGDPEFFALLNGGKSSVAVDLAQADGRASLLQLIAQADIVIEAARPRALRQLGVSADTLIASKPGLTWITITGHGALDEAANWVGFGDDCGVAAGLTAAMIEAGAGAGFVGDAIADPLTGLVAARTAWLAWKSGNGGRHGLSMSAIAAMALADEKAQNREQVEAALKAWAAATGQPFLAVQARNNSDQLRSLGADNSQWLPC
jgi:hypothetical protein